MEGHTQPTKWCAPASAQRIAWPDRGLAHLRRIVPREPARCVRSASSCVRSGEKAIKTLDTPVASPYAVTFFSLPRHFQLMEQDASRPPCRTCSPAATSRSSPSVCRKRGSPPSRLSTTSSCWRIASVRSRTRSSSRRRHRQPAGTPHQGKQCARLQIKPRGKNPAPVVLERALLALNSPQVKLPPGTLVQVSGWVRIPEAIKASPDGALFYDSAGGEALAVRITEPTPWKKFTLYRRVPSSGTMDVTVALTGLAPPTSTTSASNPSPEPQRHPRHQPVTHSRFRQPTHQRPRHHAFSGSVMLRGSSAAFNSASVRRLRCPSSSASPP